MTQSNQLHLDIIKNSFGQNSNIKSSKHGYDYYSYFINNTWTVRFPRKNIKPDMRRVNFLKVFSKITPVSIPTITVSTDKKSGLQYEISKFIPGVAFEPKVATKFKRTNLLAVATKLGQFFTTLHSYPLLKARKINIEELGDVRRFADYFESNKNTMPLYKKTVLPSLTSSQQKWVEKQFSNFVQMVRNNPFVTKLTHADMWTYHIIVDPKKEKLAGIIDFSLRIADPARDFKSIEYYGRSFVNQTYKNYDVDIDDTFDQRRLFYTLYDEVFETNRAQEEKDSTKFKKQLESLKSYVNSHS